jgi:6-phosphogluconate dehydrogenase
MKDRAEIGIVGLGTMGSNLALNFDDHGVSVALYDIDAERVKTFVREHAERRLHGAESAARLAESLARPRRVFLSVPAGDPVDAALRDLVPHLDRGDIVLDGGNSHFKDTRRRHDELAERGIHLLGVGVSGGAEGARYGPSLMPGGSREAYETVRPILEAIAAKSELGPCVGYLGPDAAGHFVKMVHNGIEYADLQAIAEAYDLMRCVAGLDADALAEIFARWNEGPLESFLVEITAAIFTVVDPETGEPFVETILDEARQKGTGRWTAIAALELCAPASAISAAVDARIVSSRREERLAASERLEGPSPGPDPGVRDALVAAAHDALYASRICAFAQGMEILDEASKEYGWNVPRAEVARIWTAGCIIRCRLLDPIREALERDPSIRNLLLDDVLASDLAGLQPTWRRAVAESARRGIPIPCWSCSLAWYDMVRSARLPHNLTQAQRDWFGAHGFRRLADPTAQPMHLDWSAPAPGAGRATG